MSIKDLFNNKGAAKIQKSVTTEELSNQIESKQYVESIKKRDRRVIPPIDFATASNFAKFGSAEIYYEKAFQRIYQYYPYDGTLHEKVEFENSSSYLDKYVFDNLYPRTNGYVNFDGSQYISVFGGPHTASIGMDGKPLDSTFDLSMKYDEEKKRTSAFEFRGEDGITAEFWLKPATISGQKAIFHISGAAGSGEMLLQQSHRQLILKALSGSSGLQTLATFDLILEEATWNHYAITLLSGSGGLTTKAYKNGQLFEQQSLTSQHIPHILPTTDSLNMTIGSSSASGVSMFSGSMDEFRFWKTARTPEDIFNTWFIPVGGGTNKYDANVDLSLYFKFNEGITGTEALDKITLDYSGRINNGTVVGYSAAFRSTGSAITEKLGEPEFQDPIIYSSHPDVVSKKAEYKTSGSLADYENNSTFFSYFPAWMQEEDEQNGKQLKFLSQIVGSYFDSLWHQINYLSSVHDYQYLSDDEKPIPFAQKLLMNEGFIMPDILTNVSKANEYLTKDDNELFSESISDVRNRIYHNLYNNILNIHKSKGTEKSLRNFLRAFGIGNEVVKLNMYADDSTFVLRNNYEYKSYERKFIDFSSLGNFGATLFQTSSNGSSIYIPGDRNYTGSFTLQSEIILPKKSKSNQNGYNPFPFLSSSIMGYRDGTSFSTSTNGLQSFLVREVLESSVGVDDSQRIKFVLTGSNISLESPWFQGQYENNKWSLAVRMKHSTYPRPNIVGSSPDDYLVEFYGVEADGNTERNSFSLSTSSVAQSYYTSNKIFYAGANKTNFSGSTLHYSDIKLGYVRYWHSYLSDDAIKQHAFDSETFGTNEPFEQDLVDTYPVEIPREKTLAFHWAFNDLTGSDSSGEFLVSDLSSGSSDSHYGPLSNTIQRYVTAKGFGFNASSSKVLDKNYLYSARKRLPDDLMSSDLTVIKTNETEQFFVDDNVSDNFYSLEKSMWGTISNEMMNMFSTALDLNNLIGQPNQRYHHKYGIAEFLRDRFFDDVKNEPDIEKFTSFYKWIDNSISEAIQQLIPASSRFSRKINNVIESHVLERNKYIHQIPITTNFSSTEGSMKGHAEMNYNWRFGHAPTNIDDESEHVLWQKDRKKKDGLREILRNSKNNHSIQSSGLTRREIDGSSRLSDSYAIRRFAKTFNFSLAQNSIIHGGTNFGKRKNIQLFHESVAPAGAVGSLGEPKNIVTVGLGSLHGLVEVPPNNDETYAKTKYQFNTKVGNQFGNDYGHDLLGEFVVPLNVMSGTVTSGFNKVVHERYREDVFLTNIHYDVVGNNNETSMQGSFTEQHVGGLQYRHIDITHDVEASGSRPEGWGLSIAEHPVDPAADGALGFVGADYGTPYPYPRPKAARYRDEYAKRPVNLRNIKTVSGSWKVGNYKNELEIFQTSPTFQKTWAVEAYNDPNVDILPPFIANNLPDSTHYQTLVGIAPYEVGNVFGGGLTGNRQPDTESLTVVVPAIGQTAGSSTFSVRGKDRVTDTNRLRIQNSVDDEIFEIDSNNNGVSQAGANAILTGSSDTDFYNNLKTSILGNLNGSFNVSYSAFAGSFSKGIQWANNGAVGLSITSSLGTELDGLPFTFSGWVDVTSDGSSVNTIYSEETSIGSGKGRVLQIVGSGTLQFIIHYVDGVGNKTDTYELYGFRASYTGTLTHVAVVKGSRSPGTDDSSLFINGSYVAWSATTLGTPSGIATINSPDLYHIGWNGSSPGFGHTSDPGIIDDVTLLNISCSQDQIDELYNGGGAIVDIQNDLGAIDFSTHVVAHYNFEESLGDVLNNSIIRDEKRFRNLVVTDSDAFNRITQVTTTLPLLYPSASFTITPTSTGSYGNLTLTEVGVAFSDLSNGSGGVDAEAGDIRFANDNVIAIPSTSSQYTSQRNIRTRFSAPGGPEIQTYGYLDAYTSTYSVHNALPFRNTSVLGPGSGEEGTIRVEDHLGLRRGLKTLRGLHMGKFGIDSQYGEITEGTYPSSGSYNKQHRNTSQRMEYSGSSIITGSNYDNAFINTPIPRSELQYSWIHNATSGSDAPTQRILGYAPRDGIVSSSAGFVEAIVFPSASSIFGS